MSYLMDLDEYDEGVLWGEIIRREEQRAAGLCDYCGYRRCVSLKVGVREKHANAPGVEKYVEKASDGPCRFPKRHNIPENTVKRISIKEFRRIGYLQEVNRRLLHPLGLALEIIVLDNGQERLGGVWDYRDDPKGINYGTPNDPALARQQSEAMQTKARLIDRLFEGRAKDRAVSLGYIVQPIDKL